MKLNLTQRELFKCLLSGMYLMRNGIKERYSYKLYSGNMNPEKYIRDSTVTTKFRLLLKTDKIKRMTLNLNVIKRMDGRTWIKKQYKKSKNTETKAQ